MVVLWDTSSGAYLCETEAEWHVDLISFSADGGTLYTDRGFLGVEFPPDSSTPRLAFARRIGLGRKWVSWGSDNILWLPAEYREGARTGATPVLRDIVALTHPTRGLSFLNFGFSRLGSFKRCKPHAHSRSSHEPASSAPD